MKRLMILALVGLMLLPGCSEVLLSQKYSLLLDTTADVSIEMARRANAGTLSPVRRTAGEGMRYSSC
jgi:hypothetical protein